MVTEEGTSWDMVSDSDIWEGGCGSTDQEDYVVVRQEDIVDGISCFMATYLLSLEETKVRISIGVMLLCIFLALLDQLLLLL